MLRILFSPKKAKRHPLETLLIGFFYSSLSVLFALWVFPDYPSIAMVFLTVFSTSYLIQSAIKGEEKKETRNIEEKRILKEHSKVISVFLFLFLGITFSFTMWAFILSPEKVSTLFQSQETVVNGLKALITTGNFANTSTYFSILTNNLKVLLISLIFAFFYGAGAIYVLVWNASVMGFVIGTIAKDTLGAIALPITFTKYFLHGIPEMIAYLVIALAGGIIYVATIKGDFANPKRRKKIMGDFMILVIISLLILLLAAFIEVYISPFI